MKKAIYLALLLEKPLMPEVHSERQWAKLLRYDLLAFSDMLSYFKSPKQTHPLRSMSESELTTHCERSEQDHDRANHRFR